MDEDLKSKIPEILQDAYKNEYIKWLIQASRLDCLIENFFSYFPTKIYDPVHEISNNVAFGQV